MQLALNILRTISLGPTAAESAVKLNMFVLRLSFRFQVSYCLILFLGWDFIPSCVHICLIFLVLCVQNNTLVQHLMAPILWNLKAWRNIKTAPNQVRHLHEAYQIYGSIIDGMRVDSWPNTDCSISSSLRSTSPSPGSFVETEPATCKELHI